MSIFSNIWPFTNLHEINLDWVISKCKEALDKAEEAINKAGLDTEILRQLDSRVTVAENVARNASSTANNARTYAESVNETANTAANMALSATARAEQAINTANTAGDIGSQALSRVTAFFNYDWDSDDLGFSYNDLIANKGRPVQIIMTSGGRQYYLDVKKYNEANRIINCIGFEYDNGLYLYDLAIKLINGETVPEVHAYSIDTAQVT